MRKQKALVLIAIFLLLLFVSFISSYAHSGRTDEEGGHDSPDGYHYHHGYPAHQHENGVCPYDFDDKTEHGTRESSEITRKTSSSKGLWSIVIVAGIFFVSFALPVIISMLRKNSKPISGCFCWLIFFVCVAILSLVKW